MSRMERLAWAPGRTLSLDCAPETAGTLRSIYKNNARNDWWAARCASAYGTRSPPWPENSDIAGANRPESTRFPVPLSLNGPVARSRPFGLACQL